MKRTGITLVGLIGAAVVMILVTGCEGAEIVAASFDLAAAIIDVAS